MNWVLWVMVGIVVTWTVQTLWLYRRQVRAWWKDFDGWAALREAASFTWATLFVVSVLFLLGAGIVYLFAPSAKAPVVVEKTCECLPER